ncbi:MAG: hypothetical protein V1742_03190, partial [Pseudomonadota bacterium]
MKDNLNQQDLAFMGMVTAGITHEMNNVLAIIRESGGLMKDLLGLFKESEFAHQEKFSRSVTRILEQVKRGVELSNRLNQFAHSMDEAEVRMKMDELLDQAVVLNRRFARLKQVSLAYEPAPDGPVIRAALFRLLRVLSVLIEYCLNKCPPGGSVVLRSGPQQPGPTIDVSLEPAESGAKDSGPAGQADQG